jgi:hypothetical protein
MILDDALQQTLIGRSGGKAAAETRSAMHAAVPRDRNMSRESDGARRIAPLASWSALERFPLKFAEFDVDL